MSYEEYEPPSRGWSPLTVAGVATLVLLLGVGGALFGIQAAHRAEQVDASSTRPMPEPAASEPTLSQTVDATRPPSESPTPSSAPAASGDQIVLPDLSAMSFRDARTRVRELKLGWRLIFEGVDDDPSVRATDPAPGSVVRRGDSIQIYVRGGTPLASVPAVTTMTCAQAASVIVEAGLYPEYLTGRDGVVVSQAPGPAAANVHWNDTVRMSCLKPG